MTSREMARCRDIRISRDTEMTRYEVSEVILGVDVVYGIEHIEHIEMVWIEYCSVVMEQEDISRSGYEDMESQHVSTGLNEGIERYGTAEDMASNGDGIVHWCA